MKIVNHRLMNDDGTPCPFVESPNIGGEVQHNFLVMHYTAGRSAQESIGWLASPQAKASAHVVIGRDGSITQLVKFDRVAWHAGVRRKKEGSGLNPVQLDTNHKNAPTR